MFQFTTLCIGFSRTQAFRVASYVYPFPSITYQGENILLIGVLHVQDGL